MDAYGGIGSGGGGGGERTNLKLISVCACWFITTAV